MKDNIILDKSFKFAVRVVKLYKYLCENKKEYVLSKQLLKSGTSYLNIDEMHTKSLVNDIQEILKLLTSIVKSSQGNK
jgi:hypothetical protein